MQEQYDAIKQARALLAKTPKSTARQTTADDYRAKVERLRERTQDAGTFNALITEALKTAKKTSWQALRAALLFTARNTLEQQMANQDKLQRAIKAQEAIGLKPNWAPWEDLVRTVENSRQALQAVLNAELPMEGRINRHTKRQDMKGLPDNWRQQVIERMPTYRLAALTAAVTGCRPAELVGGVKMTIEDGMLRAHIIGAKVDVDKGKGQEWRRLSWPLDHASDLVQDLVKATQEAGGALVAQIANASNFSKSMSNASARVWPRRKAAITPYCMRHQAASDFKASGMSSGEVSAALGHLSDVTKSTYGHANMSRSGGVAPKRVESARPVKTKAPKVQLKVSM
jgi:integrase